MPSLEAETIIDRSWCAKIGPIDAFVIFSMPRFPESEIPMPLIENQNDTGAVTGLGVIQESRKAARGSSTLGWMALVCLILAISGGYRFWRDQQFAKRTIENRECPIQLADLPKSFGVWRQVENSDYELDPEIARIAGSTAHLIRTYVDPSSGEKIQVLILYGLARSVFSHTPEICYPAGGQQPVTQPKDIKIPIPGVSEPAKVRTQVFVRTNQAGQPQYGEVYYSFRHDGSWQPDMASMWKRFRYVPGMFKIQTHRDVSAAAASPNAPRSEVSDSLFREIAKEIEQRLVATSSNR